MENCFQAIRCIVSGHAESSHRRLQAASGSRRIDPHLCCRSRIRRFPCFDISAYQDGISWGQVENGYVEVRYRLRFHIVRHLQRRLIDDGYATPAMHDDFFATDLGL
jgi:hypothetical protein